MQGCKHEWLKNKDDKEPYPLAHCIKCHSITWGVFRWMLLCTGQLEAYDRGEEVSLNDFHNRRQAHYKLCHL